MCRDESLEEIPVIRIAYTIIQQAIQDHASEIRVEPSVSGSTTPIALRPDVQQAIEDSRESGAQAEFGAPSLRVSQRVAGEWHETMPLPHYLREPIIERFKLMALVDPTVTDRSQQGHIPIRYADKSYMLLLTTTPSELGQVVHIRVES